jgi:hypothetical protein
MALAQTKSIYIFLSYYMSVGDQKKDFILSNLTSEEAGYWRSSAKNILQNFSIELTRAHTRYLSRNSTVLENIAYGRSSVQTYRDYLLAHKPLLRYICPIVITYLERFL